MAVHRRQKDSLQRIGEPDGHPPSDAFRLIDTVIALRKPLRAGIAAAGPIAISAVLIFTGRIAGIVAKLSAILRQASKLHRKRDGHRNLVIPARMPSTRATIDTPLGTGRVNLRAKKALAGFTDEGVRG